MPDNEIIIKNIIERGGEFLEIDLDNNGANEFKITLPVSYDFDFLPVDEKGKEIPVSCVMIKDTRTIINVSENSPQWKLKVIKPEERPKQPSSHDEQGTSSPPVGNEPGDRLFDWLGEQVSWENEEANRKIQGAKREIIIRKLAAGTY